MRLRIVIFYSLFICTSLFSQENNDTWLNSSFNLHLGTGYDNYLNPVSRETFVSKVKDQTKLTNLDLSKYEIYEDAGGVLRPVFMKNNSFDFLSLNLSFIKFNEDSKKFSNDKEFQVGLVYAEHYAGINYQLKNVPDTFPIYNRYLSYDERMGTIGIPAHFLVKHNFLKNRLRLIYGIGTGIDISLWSSVREITSTLQTLTIKPSGNGFIYTYDHYYEIEHHKTKRHLMLKGIIPIGFQWKIYKRLEIEAMLSHSTYYQISRWRWNTPFIFWRDGDAKEQRYVSFSVKYYFFSLDHF